ncbi:MAG TPA: efflux transporter outer membrane subunit, partial [Burkholderiaceae bacterium]|nr:efflux transporter outer membrane subunit [Burkholderiaceae bacterium]
VKPCLRLFQVEKPMSLRPSAWPFALPWAASAALLLCSCAVGPDYKTPTVAMPPKFVTQGDFATQEPLLAWWQVLSDENLTALIERAISGANLDLQSAAARIREARAQLGVASAAELPSVNANAQISRDRFSRNSELFANLPLPSPQLTFTDYRAGFDASWEIDVFGYVRRSVEAADARVQSAQANLHDVRVSVAAEVARTYIGLRQTEAQIALGTADLSALQESARLVELRFGAGNANELELHRANASIQTQVALLAALRADNGAALNALAVLVGVTPAEVMTLVKPDQPVPSVRPDRVAVGLPSDLLQRRPDVRRAERELAAATADIGVATANLYPRFTLIGNFGAESVQPGEFWQLASRTWSLAPHASLPLLGRGRLTSEVSAREAARDAALAGYQKAVLQALSDVEAAMIRYDRARVRDASLDQAARDFKANAALVHEQFDAGRSSKIDLLDAERQERQAQEQRVDAAANLATQLVALYKALGGGWVESASASAQHSEPTEDPANFDAKKTSTVAAKSSSL